MDGFAVYKQMKDDEQYKKIPMIIMTHLDLDEVSRRGIDLDSVDIIAKQKSDLDGIVENIKKRLP